MKYRLSDMVTSESEKIKIPDVLHFLWIGNSSRVSTQYMEVWRRSNVDKETIFWCEGDYRLCHFFHITISDHVISLPGNDKSNLERLLKNKAFDYIYPKLNEGLRFDDLIFHFFEENNIAYKVTDENQCSFLHLDKTITTKNISELFLGEFNEFKRFYCYEIILRGNLASASDIARLILLYKYGGTYIDMDTLPCTENVFKSLNSWRMSENYDEDEFIKLFKTKKILTKLGLLNVTDQEYTNHYCSDKDHSFYSDILMRINRDIASFSEHDIMPLGPLYVHKNLMSIGAVENIKGAYFNNIMSCHPFSKAMKIILRTMKKRYAFLEMNDCIFNYSHGGVTCSYLSRILGWRTELITKNYCVTSALTGPGLIVEVLLGLAYELMAPEYLTTPNEIAIDMHNEAMGIAFFRHNLYTPEGCSSSWRR